MINRMVLFSKLSLDLFGVSLTREEVEFRLAVAWSDMKRPFDDPSPEAIHEFSCLRQLDAVFSKEVPLDSTDLVNQSIESLRSREEEMAHLNESRPWRGQPWFPAAVHRVHSLLPPLEWVWDDVFDSCRFGSGATHSGKGPVGRHLLSKIGGTQTVTPAAVRLVGEVCRDLFPHFYSQLERLPTRRVPGNRVAFVPKDKRKVRQIAIEPSLNMFLQQGIGRFMFSLLRKHGIDLRDQTKNQRLARQGSIDGSLATIDLTDASSRICLGLVEDLLPPDWFELLCLCRSPRGLLPSGEHLTYHSFSTQGNAYTFPLETLIFEAILWSSDSLKGIYGDDIIVKSEDFYECISRLTCCGFLVNTEKSYASGRFRESCGGDYVLGLACRPVYYRESAKVDSDLCTLHNLLIERWGSHRLLRTLAYIRSCAKECLRGPRTLVSGDITAHGGRVHWRNYEFHPYTWWFWKERWEPVDTKVKNFESYALLRRYKFVPNRLRVRSTNFSRYLTFLYGGSRSIVSSSLGRYKVVNVHIPKSSIRC